MSWWFRSLSALLILITSGCGYTLTHRLKDRYLDKKGFFIPVFENRTEFVGAERAFTNALKRELLTHGEVVLASREAGGLELYGTILSLTAVPNILTEPNFGGLASFKRIPTEMGISVAVELAIRDPKTRENLTSRVFNGYRRLATPINITQDFQGTSSLAPFTQSLIETQYDILASDIVRDVYDDMVELL